MKNITLPKLLVFAGAIITTAAIPVAAVSCTDYSQLAEIKIDLPEEKIKIGINQSYVSSQPIDIVCFNKKGEKVSKAVDIILTTDKNLDPPDWIQINKDKCIEISAQTKSLTNTFHVYAQCGNIKSRVKTFSVEITDQGYLSPDRITIKTKSSHPILFRTSSGNYSLDIVPYKEGYDESLVSKDCSWKITKQTGRTKDELNHDLFWIDWNEHSAQLMMSKDITEAYETTYQLTIQATSNLNPEAIDDIELNVQIANGFVCKGTHDWIYTRKSLDEGWALSQAKSDVININAEDIDKTLLDVPVTKIDDYFAINSGITQLSSCYLPNNIIEIGQNAFYSLSTLYDFKMPSVKKVGSDAFYYCSGMNIYNEEDEPVLEEIGNRAFCSCKNILLHKQQKIRLLGDEAFAFCDMKTIDLGSNVEWIGYRAFYCDSDLDSITLEALTPPEVDGEIVSGCKSSTTIYVPLEVLNVYRKDKLWSYYAGKIAPIEVKNNL
ncbi:MAG: leucine-rich repeat domain-containing protein [Mycoplasmoidaceae bacterium]